MLSNLTFIHTVAYLPFLTQLAFMGLFLLPTNLKWLKLRFNFYLGLWNNFRSE